MKKTVVDIIDDMSVDVTDRLQFKGPIPKNIITVRNSPGNTLVAWITRPQKVRMYFTKNVDLKDIPEKIIELQDSKNDCKVIASMKNISNNL